ncbi:MAG: STAS domain-containing protein [Pseudomonadota bacterium]
MGANDSLLSVQEQGNHAEIALHCDLTIHHVARLHASLKDLVKRCESISIDMRQAGETDVAGIQLLLAVHQAMKNENKKLHFSQPSNMLADTVKLLELENVLKFSTAAAV